MKLHDLFDDIDNLFESLSFIAPPSKWEVRDDGILSRMLNVDGLMIRLNLEPKVYNLGKDVVDFINISFEAEIDGGFSSELTKLSQNGSKVIGVVSNAIKEKLSEFNYSALTFIAFDNVERRISLYSRIVSNNLHHLGKSYMNVKLDSGGTAIVVFSKDINPQWSKEFIEYVKNSNKD